MNVCRPLTSPTDAGKPHHFVCSECHLPEKLLGCGTCCRSYHAACLPNGSCEEQPAIFHCPSCRDKAWDRVPPRIPTSAAPSGSQNATPAGSTPVSTHSSPQMARRNTPSGPSSASIHGQEDDYERAHPPENLPSVSEMYPHVQAYLAQAHGLGDHPEFLRQISLMLHEVESHRVLLRKNALLREEFSRVQTENSQLRTYLHAQLPIREPAVSGPSTFSPIPRPSADTSGKSWDRIVLDLI